MRKITILYEKLLISKIVGKLLDTIISLLSLKPIKKIRTVSDFPILHWHYFRRSYDRFN